MIKDGKDNTRYLLLDMKHTDYATIITRLLKLHTNKEAGNKLTVLPNTARTRAIVKVVAHVGWLEDEKTRLDTAKADGLIINSYIYKELSNIYTLLASKEWPQEDL